MWYTKAMRRRRHIGALAGAVCLAALSGCLSVGERLGEQAARVAAGDYARAYEAAAGNAGESGTDGPFWAAEAGALALMAGRPADAVAQLDMADNGFNAVARRRLGAGAANQVAAVAVSDCVMPYAPEGQDRVFANLYKALAYGALGRPGAMRVELNRARRRQQEWFFRCAEAIEEAADASLTASEAAAARKAAGPAPERLDPAAAAAAGEPASARATHLFGRLRGFGNAYAAHVAGVARWCAGDAPLNDLAMAAALAPSNAAAQADAAAAQAGAAPKGRVWVYVEDGLAPRRVARPFTLPFPSLAGHGRGIGTLSFDVPKLESRPAAARGYAVNGVALQPLADVEALARDQFDRAWPGIVARQVARTAARVAAHEGGQAAIRHATDNALAPLLLSLALAAYDVSTNAADVRCADLLPKTVWMGALPRPADGRLTLSPQGGRAVSVALKPKGNALVWVRRPTAGGPATVMVVDLDRKE